MQYFRRGKIALLMASAMLLLSATALPVAHAQTYGPYSLSWDYAVWGNRSVGKGVEFDLYIYNLASGDPQDTISSVQLITPWQTYTATGLPVMVCYECVYGWFPNVTIPLNQQLGSVSWTLSFTGTYTDGSAFCSSSGNVCSSTLSVNIIADPQTLQTQVTSLTGQLATAEGNITALQKQVQSDQSQVSSLQTQLTNTSNTLQKAKSDLTTTQSALTAANSLLDATKATLASTQSSLAMVSSVYLPVGAAVPGVIAALLAVLYIRKGPRA